MYLSELFWSEVVRAAIFTMFLSFYFAALYLSIYLPAIYLPIYLDKVICPGFLKAVLSAKTVPFIRALHREIQIQLRFKGFIRNLLRSADMPYQQK